MSEKIKEKYENKDKSKMNKRKKVIKVRSKKTKLITAAVAVVCALCILIGALYVVPSFLSKRRDRQARLNSGMEEKEITADMSESDNNFLFSLDGAEPERLEKIGGDNLLITSNSLVTFKSSGKITATQRPGYTNPVFCFGEKRYLVFERATGKYAVMDKSETLYNRKLDSSIINADIAENGSYALITRETVTTSYVTVYNKKNKVEFCWKCTDGYLMDVALSPNGKNIVVSQMKVENGEQISSLLYFTVKSNDVEKRLDYPDCTIYEIKFLKGQKVGAVTDKSYITADFSSQESKIFSFEYDTLCGYTFDGNKNVIIVKSSFGSIDESDIVVLDKDCNTVFSTVTDEAVTDFKADSRFVYIMSDGKISIYNLRTGERSEILETSEGFRSMCINSDSIVCISEKGVYKYER